MLQRVFAGVVVIACMTGLSSAQCADGWAEIEGNCFGFVQAQSFNWNESNYYCEQIGATAAQVADADVLRGMYEYIVSFALQGDFWLGASDISGEDNWLWNDFSRVERGTPFWALHNGLFGWSLEPQGGEEENCLALAEDRFYYMDDRDCDLEYHPICMQ